MWSVHGSMVCEVVCEVVVVRRDTSVRSGRVLAVDGRRSIIIDVLVMVQNVGAQLFLGWRRHKSQETRRICVFARIQRAG